MFVISQLNFGDYLNEPCYSAAASLLPRPIDLKSQHKHRGDFDVLLLHRRYGVLVGEVKSIGDQFSTLFPSARLQDQKVAEKVKLAIRQLNRAEEVLSYLLSDQQRPPRIVKSLMMPNISSAQLQRTLDNNPKLRQVCAILRCVSHQNILYVF